MNKPSVWRNPGFLLALLMIIGTAVLGFLAYSESPLLDFIYLYVPPLPVHHWFSWAGAGFIGIYTPLFYYLKSRYREKYQTLIKIHVYGNLISFIFISLHFAEHLREFFVLIPHPGTGLPLYTAVVLLVATGMTVRFQLVRSLMKGSRSLHVSVTAAFYLIVLYHILHGLGIL